MQEDAALMQTAGVNVVRMAEFAWDRMEPRCGEFDFSVFDETIARLARHGIAVILCTPTATPPRRLTAQHEDWMRVDAEGRKMLHGSRQHCCTNHPGFRAESEHITRAMAEHFADNPHVIGWQTDNELHCHISECHCPSCIAAFRIWLEQKYGTIAKLNAAWGAAFWAQTYQGFEQIIPPVGNRPTLPNPSAQLDYFRFISDSVRDFQHGQVTILRAAQPRWRITHNGLFGHLDYWKFTNDLDFLSVDIYPGIKIGHPEDFSWASMKLEECRSAGGNFLVPEQQGGSAGYFGDLFPTPQPGQMRLWAYQSIAHGADGILHFRWRTCRFGAEIEWRGILDQDNVPRRRYAEFAQEGKELSRIGPKILGSVVRTKAAILTSFEQEEAHRTYPLAIPGPKIQTSLVLHEMLTRHLPCGLVDAADSFDGLELIILPSFPLQDENLAEKLHAFVESGGVLVATARTSIRNGNNHVLSITPPGGLAGLFGITVEEFGRTDFLSIERPGADDVPAGLAYEALNVHEADVLGTWSHPADGAPHAAAGHPALTITRRGRGASIYIGTYFSQQNVAALLEGILQFSPLPSLAQADPFVEIVCRQAGKRRLYFVLNHYAQPKTVTALPEGRELLGETRCAGSLELPAFGVAVIECRQP